jgi:6-phosphogluconolactonase
VQVHRDPDLLAAAIAARLVCRLVDAQATRGSASLVLTGGRIGISALAALAASPARDAIDWANLRLWWGDERYLPPGDPERNDTQARKALLDLVTLDPAKVHPFGAPGTGPATGGASPGRGLVGGASPGRERSGDPESAADRYAAELEAHAKPGQELPHFDIVLLGVGPDGHIASVFPESPAAHESRPVVAVHGSPKPPPTRLTLTLPAINTADEVWLLASGEEKADAVGLALAGAGPVQLPAAGARGLGRTLWLLDRAAASRVPKGFRDQRWP